MLSEKTTDLLGVASTARTVVGLAGHIILFAAVLLFGDCSGCIDTVEIIHAVRGDGVEECTNAPQ